MIGKAIRSLRSLDPSLCLRNPRMDTLRGVRRWGWLYKMRRSGRLIDPSIEIRAPKSCYANIKKYVNIERNAAVDKGCIFWIGEETGNKGKIQIGERVYLGPYTYLGSCNLLSIGKETMVGANSYIITVNHRSDMKDIPYNQQGYIGQDTIIGNNVWIGCHVVVLPGIVIGDSAIIGAGSVVTKSVPAGEVWAGVPAKKVK